MKAVQLLVNSVLPEDLRNYDQTYDVKSLNKIMNAVGKKYPEQFDDILHKIANIGRKASYYQGETITLDDLENVIDKDALFAEMDKEIAALPKDKNFIRKRREIFQKYNELMEKETGKAALANRNNLAMAILSGARGKSPQLKAMVTSPGTYSDYKGEPIDVFSRTSFAEGLSPTAFAASTYGSRAATVSTKCLDYQSLTKMADLSEKRLCDIKVGDMVLGADKEGRVFPVKVLNVFDQGEKECYKYTFRYSNSKIGINDMHVTCTEDHKFLVISAREYSRKRSLHSRGNGPAPTWRDRHNKEIHPASKFNRTSHASVYNPLLPQGGLFGTKYEPWARILGLLIGDGCLVGKQVRCTLSCADEQLIEEITPELTALGQKIKKVGGDNFSWNITKADYDPTQNNSIVKGVQGFVAGSLMDRNQMLKDYGLLGHYAWEKRFPIGWQSWDAESMKNLIAGLFAADGCVFSNTMPHRTQVSVSFGMTSEDCLKDLREALMYGFGISSRFEKPTTKGGFGSTTDERVHPLYALEISRAEDVIKFCEVFSDYVPGIKRAKLIEETSKIVIKDHNPYAKAMFLEKEYVGKVHCMDIEVDHPDHLFVLANGLITSNSSTAKGGDLAKQMAQSTVDMVVRERDCGTHNGLVYGIDEPTLKGRVLARETAGIPADTLIDREVLHKLRKAGVEEVEARSPLTCSVKHGLCSRCIGKYYNGGKWAPVGTHVGAIASTSSSEPVCLVKGTEVRMADGSVKKIEDIEPGEYVLGSDMNGYCKPTKVVNKFHNGPRNCYRSYIKKGYGRTSGYITLESTAEHKILGTVRSGNTPLHKAELNIAAIGTMPESKYTVRLCQSITGSEGGEVHEPMAMQMGMSHMKTLPKSIWSWDTESVCKFVGGLIATDGYITKTGLIGYSSNNIELLKQIKELLQFRLGVYSTNISCSRKKKPDGTYYNPTYFFTINEANNVLRFAEMIDIPGRKAALLAAANRKSNCKRRGLYKLEKQEWLGVQDTWDLEVDNDTHLFALANGLIVSNTQMALCLHADTQVVMADGGFKKIKNIIPGDIVIGSDRKGNQKPVEVVSKFRQGTKKVRVYVAEAYADYSTEDPFSLVPQDYSTMLHVTCTPEHKMLMADGSIRPIDDCITCAEENLFLNTIYGKAKVVSSSGPMDAPCYDIEVDHPDHLFLLANGMITSNSAKHTAGMTQSKKTYSGLDALIQFTQSPEKFKDQGAVSELDGKVENIEEAPQGGMLVTIAGKQHYVPQGHEVEVKVGDKVEAGDQLAEGLVDAEDIVRLKGLGEGRKYYAERLNKMLADSGAATDKRNTEIIARGALRHVRVTNDEGMGDYLPDDVIDYNALQGSYRPSETSQTMAPDAAVGKYLQTPVMHYTIGTRITPKVAANLKKHNHNEIDVDDVEPGFKAEMIRLRASSHTNPDWLASLGTSYLGKQLNEASTKGDDTNVLENVDYRPRLAFGKDFGRKADQTGIF